MIAIDGSHSLDEQLRFAIAHKRLVHVSYGGRVRIAEPHDYGIKNGSPKLLIYQLRGGSAAHAKGAQGWRLLEVAKIEACTVTEETFPGSRNDSSRGHTTWEELFARVG